MSTGKEAFEKAIAFEMEAMMETLRRNQYRQGIWEQLYGNPTTPTRESDFWPTTMKTWIDTNPRIERVFDVSPATMRSAWSGGWEPTQEERLDRLDAVAAALLPSSTSSESVLATEALTERERALIAKRAVASRLSTLTSPVLRGRKL